MLKEDCGEYVKKVACHKKSGAFYNVKERAQLLFRETRQFTMTMNHTANDLFHQISHVEKESAGCRRFSFLPYRLWPEYVYAFYDKQCSAMS
jgi:hypothetical protein